MLHLLVIIISLYYLITFKHRPKATVKKSYIQNLEQRKFKALEKRPR